MDAAEPKDSPLPLGLRNSFPPKKTLRNLYGDVRAFCITKRPEILQNALFTRFELRNMEREATLI